MATKVYVGGLSAEMDESYIRQLVAKYGAVSAIDLFEETVEGDQIKYAMLSFDQAQDAVKTITALNGKVFLGQKVRAGQARTMQDIGAKGNARLPY